MTVGEVESLLGGFNAIDGRTGVEEIDALWRASRRTVERDRHLLEHQASERALCHRLAVYLECELRQLGLDWNVDCEYNRVGGPGIEDRVKRLSRDCPGVKRDNVSPDVIVHTRGNNDNNRLVLEAKLLSDANAIKVRADACKLKFFAADAELHYREVIFALFVDGAEPNIALYRRSAGSTLAR